VIKFCNRYLPSRLFVFLLLDGLLITAALLWSFDATAIRLFALSPSKALIVICVSVVVCLWCFYFFDLYDLDSTRTGRDVLLQALRSLGSGVLLLTPIWWLLLPRGSSYRGLEFALVLFLPVLCVYRFSSEWLRKRILPGDRVLLVGSGPSIRLLAGAIAEKYGLPLKLTGVVRENAGNAPDTLTFASCGHLCDLDRIVVSLRPNRIAIGMEPDAESPSARRLVELRRQGIRVDDATALYEEITGRVPVSLISDDRLAFGMGFRLSRATKLAYHAAGATFAVLAAVLLSPLLLGIAILIKLESKGPILYRQERLGYREQPFYAIKFRSMRMDAEKDTGPVWATESDPRVTRVGRVLRTLRLDELPQLWNVLRGEMCLVGPRPERLHFVATLREDLPFYELRHTIPPGITGWAQVCASYGSNLDESRLKLEYDLFYLKNRSVIFDLLILCKTAKIVAFGRGAR
jgi:exopolysaccharide biosynthesis polyprenyl glycosylphosphotransferase